MFCFKTKLICLSSFLWNILLDKKNHYLKGFLIKIGLFINWIFLKTYSKDFPFLFKAPLLFKLAPSMSLLWCWICSSIFLSSLEEEAYSSPWGDAYAHLVAHSSERFKSLPAIMFLCLGNRFKMCDYITKQKPL